MQNRQKKFKHYENSRDTGRTFQALVTTMKIQGKARLRLSKLAKQMLYIKYWEHKKKHWNQKDRLSDRWSVHIGFYHMWQYFQILYNAAIWNSGEPSLSTEMHFQKKKINLTWTLYISSNRKWIYRWLMSSFFCVNIIITRSHLSSLW